MTISSACSDYLENKLLNHALGKVDYTKPSSAWLGLCTQDPTDAWSSAAASSAYEINPGGGGYTRMFAPFGLSTTGIAVTTALITFPQATADWGSISWWGIFDASTIRGGNLLFRGEWDTAKTVSNGSTVKVTAGSLAISLD